MKIMTAILETPNESLKLSGISWETYTHLLDDLSKQHRLRFMQLKAGEYKPSEESSIFPNLPLSEIGNFLKQVGEVDYLDLIKMFRL
jgi:hypothetical protein